MHSLIPRGAHDPAPDTDPTLPVLASIMVLVAAFFDPYALLAAPLLGAVITELGEGTTNEEHLVRDVSDAVTYMDEVRQVPLDQMMRRARRRKPADNVIIEWENVDRTPPRQDTIQSGSTGHASEATVTLDVGNGAMWRRNDLAMIPDRDPTAPLLLVVGVNYSDNTIDVKALPPITNMIAANKTREGQAFGTVPDVASDDLVVRLTPSKTESDVPSESRMTQPELYWNFIHTFDAVVKASDHRQRTKNYTMQDWQRGRADSLIDLRRSMEYNMFCGQPSVTYDPDSNKLRFTMAGLLHYINQSLDYDIASGITESNIIDWHTEIYTGNTGSDTRLMFCDKYLAAEIDKVMLQKMDHLPTRTVAGVRTTELSTRHGTSLVVHHPGFDELGRSHYGVFVDLDYINKVELQPLEKRMQDLKGSTGEDADQEQYIEKSSLEVQNSEVHYEIEGS